MEESPLGRNDSFPLFSLYFRSSRRVLANERWDEGGNRRKEGGGRSSSFLFWCVMTRRFRTISTLRRERIFELTGPEIWEMQHKLNWRWTNWWLSWEDSSLKMTDSEGQRRVRVTQTRDDEGVHTSGRKRKVRWGVIFGPVGLSSLGGRFSAYAFLAIVIVDNSKWKYAKMVEGSEYL